MTMSPDTLTRFMTEDDLLRAVTELAQWLGYLTYHPWRSDHSAAGWPDLAMVGHGRFLMAELKTPGGRVSAPQHAWHDALSIAGIPIFIWRPKDWASGEIERVLRVGTKTGDYSR